MEAQIADYGNIVEALMSLIYAAERLRDGCDSQTVAVDVTVLHKQSSIIGEYWKILKEIL